MPAFPQLLSQAAPSRLLTLLPFPCQLVSSRQMQLQPSLAAQVQQYQQHQQQQRK